ncbi:MAG: zinc-binding dehydrogenase, partial [Acidobacteriota bacterium]|nr:zinc-binding dehydrogenase [Acidobacteriota bacterium]
RLLLTNTDIVGVAWGGYAIGRPELCREIGAALEEMIGRGVVAPLVGERFPLERASDALVLIDERRATGKVVLDVIAGGPGA